MKTSITTITTTFAFIATATAMFLACSSPVILPTQTEPQDSAAQPIATLQTTGTRASEKGAAPTTTGKETSNNASPASASESTGNPATAGRLAFATATPKPKSPIETPTTALLQQQGGSVILASPTPTPTLVPTPTYTPVPLDTPYWTLFSTADYNQFLPPAGPIVWNHPHYSDCLDSSSIGLVESTPEGIKDRLEWDYDRARKAPSIVIDQLIELHPDLVGKHRSLIDHVCARIEALHPRIPVSRVTMALNVEGDYWTDDEGIRRPTWSAYRVEARHIYTQGEDRPKLEQLGPILIERLGNPCDRQVVMWAHDSSECLSPR